MRFKNKISSRIVLWISIVCMFLLLNNNRVFLFVYYNYGQYKISSKLDDSMANIDRTIDAAKEAGYTCQSNNFPVNFSVKEIQKRKHRESFKFIDYSQAYKYNCATLPTGEIFLIISDGSVRYYIVLKEDPQKTGEYHILDIKGQTLG